MGTMEASPKKATLLEIIGQKDRILLLLHGSSTTNGKMKRGCMKEKNTMHWMRHGVCMKFTLPVGCGRTEIMKPGIMIITK